MWVSLVTEAHVIQAIATEEPLHIRAEVMALGGIHGAAAVVGTAAYSVKT